MPVNLDIEVGLDALKAFHNQSSIYPSYGMTWDEFKNFYGTTKFNIYADGIGFTARLNNMSQSEVNEILINLAKDGKGRIPENGLAFQNAVGKKATEISWLNVAVESAKGVAVETVKGAAVLGNTIITSLSWLTTLLPFLVVGGALLFFASKTNAVNILKGKK